MVIHCQQNRILKQCKRVFHWLQGHLMMRIGKQCSFEMIFNHYFPPNSRIFISDGLNHVPKSEFTVASKRVNCSSNKLISTLPGVDIVGLISNSVKDGTVQDGKFESADRVGHGNIVKDGFTNQDGGVFFDFGIVTRVSVECEVESKGTGTAETGSDRTANDSSIC